MRRTLERGHFSVSGVALGEVVVASTFPHSTRGTVSCPAAPVARAGMLACGLPVQQRPVPTGVGGAVLHAVSYMDPGGQVVGLGVAAHRDDAQAVRRAEDVVREWAEVMRTRRVLLEATGPSCAGLRREAALLARVPRRAYLLTGEHEVPSRWPWHDVRAVERLADVPDGATVVLPARGVDPHTAAEAAARDITVVDATCPLVARVQATARRFADEEGAVVVIGGTGHAAVPPLAAHAPGSAVVTSTEEIDNLMLDTSAHAAFVVSPGLPVEDASVLAAHLRSRFAGTIGQHPDEFCYAASDRRAAVHAVASGSELTLVLGDVESADTRALTTTAAATGNRVELLDDIDRLRPEWLRPATSVGVLVSASSRPGLADELVAVLSGLGPLSITRRYVSTEVEHTTPVHTQARRVG